MSLFVYDKIKAIKDNVSIINTIRHTNSLDLKSIADRVEFSWPTVKSAVDDLVKKEIIIDNKDDINKRFVPKKDFGYFLGIAVGATETKCIILDFNFEPIDINSSDAALYFSFKENLEKVMGPSLSDEVLCFKTLDNNVELKNLCSYIVETALDLFDNVENKDLLAIGVSFPAIIDKKKDEISFCTNIPQFVAMPLSTIIRDDLVGRIENSNIICHFCHDTVAATVYEKEYLYASDNVNCMHQDKKNIVTIYMGYGIGCGIILNNALVLGTSGAAGEIGHIPVEYIDLEPTSNMTTELQKIEKQDKDFYFWRENAFGTFDNLHLDDVEKLTKEDNIDINSTKCTCGNNNCLERLIRIKVFNSNDIRSFSKRTQTKYLERFHIDHPYRYRVFKHYLATILCMITNFLNVDLVILSGRLLNDMPQLRKDIDGLLAKYSLTASSKYCRVLNGSGKADTVAIGAAIMAYYSIGFNKTDDVEIKW